MAAGSPIPGSTLDFPALGALAILSLAAGIKNLRVTLTAQWRWTWFAALLGMTVFMGTIWFGCWQLGGDGSPPYFHWGESWSYLAGTLALFVVCCLLQIQVGLHERSSFLVNLGVVFIALDIVAAYFDLFGTMARTGLNVLDFGNFPDRLRSLSRKETPQTDETNQNFNRARRPDETQAAHPRHSLCRPRGCSAPSSRRNARWPPAGSSCWKRAARGSARSAARRLLILNYKISDVPVNLFSPPVKKDLPPGTKIFVALAPGIKPSFTKSAAPARTNFLNAVRDMKCCLSAKASTRGWNATNSIHVRLWH